MKLSDMLTALADNTRNFEERMEAWQAAMTKNSEEAMDQARKWQESAMQRQEEMNRQIRAHMEGTSDTVRSQWQQMQQAWESQFETLQKQGEEMRTNAMKMGGTDGKGFADWAEAYAAQMVGFAQKMQSEAASAIATATEARNKSGKA
ncbi:hypothetical protein [Paracoccus rhizosphaerae]|uniref:Phasin protein n=1 Tax=Paracoccus rhizosphaerae TaxID=1133347 RepID=A0ABV6CEB0_9RHOB|nr:hypothetical protein [Paracoccus rhizosphaerae]